MQMRRWLLLFPILALSLALPIGGRAQDRSAHVAQTEPLKPEEQLRRFKVPPGFEVQLVAAEPEVRKPINLNFDHRRRLYVTQSVEYPYPAKDVAAARDEVRVLSEFNESGRAGKIATFAGGLNIPIGMTPLADGGLVYSIPNLYRLWDADGDGQAERREVLYREFGFRDTHGMCSSLNRWIDGWVYACHGFSNTSEVRGADGQAITMQSGNTFRMRPDGSHVEQFTQGQVNPFGMAFDPLGNIYTADCHTKPVYMLLRGACYPSFGKPHDGLGFGPEMCGHSHGSTGIAGVVYYAADHFPEQYRGTLFIGNPITHRVNHDRLEPHGSTYRAIEQPDFLVCDDPWFRPVDVRLGPDGALYIADFYNRIIGHYEVPLDHPGRDRERGRIWRVVYRGEKSQAAVSSVEDLTKLSPKELCEKLKDANLLVRTQATNELVDRFGAKAIENVKALVAGDSSPTQRAHGLWVLERLGALDNLLLAQFAADEDRLVRVHVMKMLAERADWSGQISAYFAIARGRLKDDDAFVRRAAAEALGRHPHFDNVALLLELWAATPSEDTHLVHVTRMALRDQLLAPAVLAELHDKCERFIADLPRLTEVALGVPNENAAAFLLDALRSKTDLGSRLAAVVHHTGRHLAADRLPAFHELVEKANWGGRLSVLRSVQRASQERGAPLPANIVAMARRLALKRLGDADAARVQEGLDLAREYKLADLHEALATHVGPSARFAALRPAAIDACVAADAAASTPLLGGLLENAAEPLPVRQKAAQALGSIAGEAARAVLVANLSTAPSRLAIDIATALAANRPGAELLLAAIEKGKASPQLLHEPPVLLRLLAAKVPEMESRKAKLTAGLPPRDEQVRQLIDRRRDVFLKTKPDLALGQQLFQKTCAACHRVGGKGAKIGPDLDGIGNRGLERLLEDVVDPNRNVDQAFRSSLLTTTDGRALTGLVLREEGQVLVLADAQGKEVRVSLSDIAERELSPLSPMPANAVELVKEPDFYHLLGYLLSQRQAVEND